MTSRMPRTSRPGCGGWPRTTATRCASSAPWTPRSAWSTGRTGASSRCPARSGPAGCTRSPSQHLATLTAGEGTELLVLSPHGHVEQHALVAEDGETTWLDTEPGATAGLLTYLEKMRFFSQVEPRDATAERALLSLVGPAAPEALAHARRDRAGRTGRGRGAGSEVRRRRRAAPSQHPVRRPAAARRRLGPARSARGRPAGAPVGDGAGGGGAARRGRAGRRPLGVRGDPGGRPAAPGRGGHRPPDDPGRGGSDRPRRCTWTRAATGGRRRWPGCTTWAGRRAGWCCCTSTG